MKILILLSLIFTSSVFARCACERASLEVGIATNKNIFRALVTSVSGTEIKLKKVEVYNGTFFEKISSGTTSCAPQFKVGDENIFYLNEPKIETECDHYFSVKNEGMFQHFLKLKNEIKPSKK